MITFQNVYKEYKNGVQALMDINMEIPYGQFVFIVGASGAGKSSLIKLLICEEKVSRGHIYVNNKDITELSPWYIPKLRRQVGVVFQDFRLLQKKTAYENVAIARAIVNKPPVLVCDEPTGNLDFETAMTVMQTLKRINDDGATVIMATHARKIVNHMQRRVITLDNGRIISDVNVGGYDAVD